ncbi:MAG: hypothetical protein NC925_04125 [Candidatus Omnitrophica bacterium]|nr:hypothetical protein [Candidatus Omnitrophota bacterium]MCM8830876.1 hypothetical protein [Candidatus Omnitrophota bacterium]
MIYLVILPIFGFVVGLVLIKLNKKFHNLLVIFLTLACMAIVLRLYYLPCQSLKFDLTENYYLLLKTGRFNLVILFFANLFGFLVGLYSLVHTKRKLFYLYILLLLGFNNLVLLSSDFISFIFGWTGILVLLFLILSLDNWDSARKALIILGLADFSLILGAGILCFLNKSILFDLQNKVILNSSLSWFAFLLLLAGALAKAGSLPFHTWIPTAAEFSIAETMAILPASLDKLLGIYFLGKICLDFFVLNHLAYMILLFIGAITIIFAVFMALVQHDLRKLLSFHAISQVGYMILGFGMANPIGIVGGIFHMINHSIYKSGLFLVGGYIGKQNKTFLLEDLGNLAKFYPISFISALIFSLSISGIPPFNGFASKWLIYQSVFLEIAKNQGILKSFYIFSLISAMFGSALTLASFVKFISGVFFGKQKDVIIKSKENLSICLPFLVLSILCIILGIFPLGFLKKFIANNLGFEFAFLGLYKSIYIFSLIIFSLIFGLFLIKLLNFKIKYDAHPFVGSETTKQDFSFPSVEYYKNLEKIKPTSIFYNFSQIQTLDLYNLVLKVSDFISLLLHIFIDRFIYQITTWLGYLILGLSWFLRKLHTGILDTYLFWIFAGIIILGIYFNLLI